MDLIELCEKAKKASYEIAVLDTATKNNTLLKVADEILEQKEIILMENAKDITNATSNGMHIGLVDRLRLNDERR